MISASGKKQDREQSASQELLEDPQVDRTRAIVTADALHTRGKTAQIIVEGGGDYILLLKGNQPSIACVKKTAACPQSRLSAKPRHPAQHPAGRDPRGQRARQPSRHPGILPRPQVPTDRSARLHSVYIASKQSPWFLLHSDVLG